MSLPSILHVRDLRRVLDGWSTYRIKSFLRANGLALLDAEGTVYTTDELLRERMPDAHRAMDAKWSMGTTTGFDGDDFSDLDEV